MYEGLLFWQQDDKNASQTKRGKLLDGLAVRRCVGMQPAAMGSMAGPLGAKRVGKSAADLACQPFVATGGGRARQRPIYKRGSSGPDHNERRSRVMEVAPWMKDQMKRIKVLSPRVV